MTPPYCLSVSSILRLPPTSNFLATQVWPSSRVAARALEEYGESIGVNANNNPENKSVTTICELGCGPGLPSLTAAVCAARKTWKQQYPCQVIATDIDDLALELVMAAAEEQSLESVISTRNYDLIAAEWDGEWMDDVDLFVMSDVFESEAVAKGAAKLTQRVLDNTNNDTYNTKLWVFAQSDRAQREVYLQELRKIMSPKDEIISRGWISFEDYDSKSRLWLCDLDETKVNYG
ncbi:MAG: hypothetical protein SGILL_006542 [Bacillariaceae sp.]